MQGVTRQDRNAWLVTAAATVAAVLMLAGLMGTAQVDVVGRNLAPLLGLTVICLMATLVPPRIPWMSMVVSEDTLPVVVAAALFGPLAGFIVGVFGTMVIRQLWQRKYRAFLFNRAIMGLAGGLSGVVYHALAGAPNALLSVEGALAFACAIMAYTILNHALASLYVAMGRGSRIMAEAGAFVRQMGLVVLGALILGPLGLAAYHLLHAPGLVLLIVPVVGVNLLLGRYEAYTKAFLEGVESLATALGAKDVGTLEHSRRVGEYAAQIARHMHLSEAQVGLMYYNGLLHDIGKLGVCDEVLKKPGLLTVSEYEQIKVHAALGEQFTAPFWRKDTAARSMNYVSYHHERWDGRGYPRGLTRDEIPLGGRILAVADAFDAMTADRPYHKGVARETAFGELIRCAGVQFDPGVVRAFLECQGVDVPSSYDVRVRAQERMAMVREPVVARVVPSRS